MKNNINAGGEGIAPCALAQFLLLLATIITQYRSYVNKNATVLPTGYQKYYGIKLLISTALDMAFFRSYSLYFSFSSGDIFLSLK